MLSFFTSGSVPIPSMPNITLPSVNSITNSIVESVNSATNSMNNVSLNLFSNNKNKGNNANNRGKGNVSKSFLETI